MLVSANIFQPLIDVFQSVILFFHNNVGISWGWSIVLLTVCVRLVMVPLFIKQFQSMRTMQQHMPELNAIKEKYKADRTRQQEEMMKFYRENHINPFASCLPMVLQLPVFISLFYMLRQKLRDDICLGVQVRYRADLVAHHHMTVVQAHGQTIECSHYGPYPPASFLFIHDITASATGLTLIALLILYVGTQLASTLMMAQPTMDANQRRLMLFMPLIFVPFIIRFPAGLLVYWITTNAWTMGQQFVMRRRIGPTIATPPATGSSGGSKGSSLFSRLLPPPKQPPTGESSGRSEASSNGSDAGAEAGRDAAGRSAGTNSAGAAPPPPPRKKKKRSGRRR